jgi:hypothetical protein
MSQFSDKHLECFEGDCFATEECVGRFDVSLRFCCREADRAPDAIEVDSNHFFESHKIAISLKKFLLGDGVFATVMMCDVRGGGIMHGCRAPLHGGSLGGVTRPLNESLHGKSRPHTPGGVLLGFPSVRAREHP